MGYYLSQDCDVFPTPEDSWEYREAKEELGNTESDHVRNGKLEDYTEISSRYPHTVFVHTWSYDDGSGYIAKYKNGQEILMKPTYIDMDATMMPAYDYLTSCAYSLIRDYCGRKLHEYKLNGYVRESGYDGVYIVISATDIEYDIKCETPYDENATEVKAQVYLMKPHKEFIGNISLSLNQKCVSYDYDEEEQSLR